MNGVTITASALPTGPATATTAIGPYEGLGAAWAGLVERTRSEGLQPRGIFVDIYVTNPSDTALEDLRTDIILPLA